MKTLLTLMLVVTIAPLADALTVSLSLDGVNPAPEEIDVFAGQVFNMYVISDTDGIGYWRQISTDNPVSISNAQSYPAAGNLARITDLSGTYASRFDLWAEDSSGNIQAGKHFSFDLTIDSDAAVGTKEYVYLEVGLATEDILRLTVVPEPASFVLFALVGLFLRKR